MIEKNSANNKIICNNKKGCSDQEYKKAICDNIMMELLIEYHENQDDQPQSTTKKWSSCVIDTSDEKIIKMIQVIDLKELKSNEEHVDPE